MPDNRKDPQKKRDKREEMTAKERERAESAQKQREYQFGQNESGSGPTVDEVIQAYKSYNPDKVQETTAGQTPSFIEPTSSYAPASGVTGYQAEKHSRLAGEQSAYDQSQRFSFASQPTQPSQEQEQTFTPQPAPTFPSNSGGDTGYSQNNPSQDWGRPSYFSEFSSETPSTPQPPFTQGSVPAEPPTARFRFEDRSGLGDAQSSFDQMMRSPEPSRQEQFGNEQTPFQGNTGQPQAYESPTQIPFQREPASYTDGGSSLFSPSTFGSPEQGQSGTERIAFDTHKESSSPPGQSFFAQNEHATPVSPYQPTDRSGLGEAQDSFERMMRTPEASGQESVGGGQAPFQGNAGQTQSYETPTQIPFQREPSYGADGGRTQGNPSTPSPSNWGQSGSDKVPFDAHMEATSQRGQLHYSQGEQVTPTSRYPTGDRSGLGEAQSSFEKVMREPGASATARQEGSPAFGQPAYSAGSQFPPSNADNNAPQVQRINPLNDERSGSGRIAFDTSKDPSTPTSQTRPFYDHSGQSSIAGYQPGDRGGLGDAQRTYEQRMQERSAPASRDSGSYENNTFTFQGNNETIGTQQRPVSPVQTTSGAAQAPQERSTVSYRRSNDTLGKDSHSGSTAGTPSAQRRPLVTQNEQGVPVAGYQQGARSKLGEAQDAYQQFMQTRGAAAAPTLFESSGLQDKATLGSYREALGYGRNVSGATPDEAFVKFTTYARAEGYQADLTAAYTQSRLFQQNLQKGMSEAEAYAKSGETIREMLRSGHTYESIAATIDPKAPLNQAQVEWLKKNGTGAMSGPNNEFFSVGQRLGEKAGVGAVYNPGAAQTAARVAGADKAIPFSQRQSAAGSPPGGGGPVPGAGNGKHVPVTVAKTSGTADSAKSNQTFRGRRLLYTASGAVVTNTLLATGKFAASTGKLTLRTLPMVFYMGAGEPAQGIRHVQEAAMIANVTIGISIANKARQIANLPLRLELRGLLDQRGFKTVEEAIKHANASLQKAGLQTISTRLSGRQLTLAANEKIRLLKKLSKNNPSSQAITSALGNLKDIKKMGLKTTFAKKPRSFKFSHRMLRIAGIGLRKLMQSAGEGGRGLQTVVNYARYGVMGGKALFRSAQLTARAGLGGASGLMNASGWLAGKAANKIAKSPNAPKAMKKVGDKLGRYSKGVKKVNNKRIAFRNKRQALRDKVTSKVKDPFGLRAKMRRKIEQALRKSGAKLAAKSSVARAIGKAGSLLARAASTIATAISTLLHWLLIIGGGLLLLIIFIILIMAMITALLSAFNFSSYDETVREYIIETIADCYEEDMNKILALSDSYEDAELTRDDTFKDTAAYTEWKEEYDADAFIQSSNCAEIISMTLVRFGFDVEGADDAITGRTKSDIKQYIRELWYGSHEIYVNESTTTYQVQTGEDSDGNPIYETSTKTTATITYRTYYFEYLFNEDFIESGLSATPVIYNNAGANGTYGYVLGQDSIYAFLREAGLSHAGASGIMGNIQQESNFDPTAGTSYFGLVQWGGSTLTALRNYCASNGLDYTTSTGQLNFLIYDLQNNITGSYSQLWSLLTGDEYADDPKACASFFCVGYERCVGGSDAYEYWDVYSPYDRTNENYGSLYQELDERIAYARNFYSTYAAYADDWSDLLSGGQAIVEYAIQYVGQIHYTMGGSASSAQNNIGTRYSSANCSDLADILMSVVGTTAGTDCSGFISIVFKHFGITVPTTTDGYKTASAYEISFDEIEPGDILWRDGHVGLYIGNGQLVEMSSCDGGTHSTDCKIDTDVSGFTKAYRYWG